MSMFPSIDETRAAHSAMTTAAENSDYNNLVKTCGRAIMNTRTTGAELPIKVVTRSACKAAIERVLDDLRREGYTAMWFCDAADSNSDIDRSCIEISW